MLHERLDEEGESEETREMTDHVENYRTRLAEIAKGIRNLPSQPKVSKAKGKRKAT